MRFTIKIKLALAFAVTFILLATMGFLSISDLSSLDDSFNTLVNGGAQRVKLALETKASLIEMAREEKDMVLADTKEDIDLYDGRINGVRHDLEEEFSALRPLVTGDDARELADLEKSVADLEVVQDKIRTFARDNENDMAVALSMGDGARLSASVDKRLKALVDSELEDMAAETDRTNSVYKANRSLTFVILAVALAIGTGMALWISIIISRGLGKARDLANAVAIGDLEQRIEVKSNDEIRDLVDSLNSMTRNLRATAAIADGIAGGDLTVEAKRMSDKDTLGMALERMLDKLRTVVSDALSASDNVSSGSQELSASAEQLAQGATEQASAGEQASSSMEEMASNIKQNADNAAQTEKIARQSAQDAQISGDAVNRAVEAMQTIADKISIVQEIARQTDLLALNAAVEAARAIS